MAVDTPLHKESHDQIVKDFGVLPTRYKSGDTEKLRVEMKPGTFPRYILNPSIPDNPWDGVDSPNDDSIRAAEMNNQTPTPYSLVIGEELSLMLDPAHNPGVASKDVLSSIKDGINNGSLTVMGAWGAAREEWRDAERKFKSHQSAQRAASETEAQKADKKDALAALKNW